MPADSNTASHAPWWRHGHVWLIIAGPLAVVVAGFATLWLAVRTPDPVVTSAPARRAQAAYDAHTPAQQARNHAATPADRP